MVQIIKNPFTVGRNGTWLFLYCQFRSESQHVKAAQVGQQLSVVADWWSSCCVRVCECVRLCTSECVCWHGNNCGTLLKLDTLFSPRQRCCGDSRQTRPGQLSSSTAALMWFLPPPPPFSLEPGAMSKTLKKRKNHWTNKVHESVLFKNEDGELGLELKGGAENGQFPVIAEPAAERALCHSGKLLQDELLLEVNDTPVVGLTTRDVHAVVRHSKNPVRLKCVKQGKSPESFLQLNRIPLHFHNVSKTAAFTLLWACILTAARFVSFQGSLNAAQPGMFTLRASVTCFIFSCYQLF